MGYLLKLTHQFFNIQGALSDRHCMQRVPNRTASAFVKNKFSSNPLAVIHPDHYARPVHGNIKMDNPIAFRYKARLIVAEKNRIDAGQNYGC
jgi:hypothetical protein